MSADEPPPPPPSPEPRRIETGELVRIGAVTAFTIAFVAWAPAGDVLWRVAAALVVALGGVPIWLEASEAVVHRRMTMEFSMALAMVAALAIGEWTAGLVILDFVLVAELLEGLTVGRGRRAIGELLALLPQVATIKRDGGEADAPVASIGRGDVVVVRPGARIPVDGVAVAGRTFVDESSVTGEAMPVEKLVGSRVFAGTINQRGTLDVRTERVGTHTVFGRIVTAVEEAEASRAPVQRLADRVAGRLVYFALAAAAVTFLLTRDLRATISVVLVAGACGIAAGTPLALLGAVGSAARAGAIVKGGVALEALADLDVVVFDKTGTLTLGRPVVVSVNPAPGVTPERLLATAASVERPSEHPLGRAIVRRATELSLPLVDPIDFESVPGLGVRARIEGRDVRAGSEAWVPRGAAEPAQATGPAGVASVRVAVDGAFLGTVHVADEVRDDTLASVAALRAQGLRVVLLTGDTVASAEDLGRRLELDEARGALLPQDKLAFVDRLVGEGRRVAMVGDGINDAPALARATVGVAIGTGTDVAMETSAVILLGGRIASLLDAIRLARRCRAIVGQNLVGTIAVDSIGMALAGTGVLSPVPAGIVHVVSELAFILNSTRLLPRRRRARRASG